MEIELIEAATTEIAEYNQTEAALTELRERMAGVEYEVTTVKGMAVAKADRAEVRGLRTALEAKRKEIKGPALEHCRLIDAEAKRITIELLKLEEPIDAQIKIEEARKEVEREARELAERQRITAIHERIAAIREYVALALSCRTSERVQSLQDKLAEIDTSTGFDEFQTEAAEVQRVAGQRVEEILTEKLADEAEKERIKAEQARIKAEQQAEAARLKAERAELEAQRAAQVAAAQAAQARIDEANAAIAQEREAFERTIAVTRASWSAVLDDPVEPVVAKQDAPVLDTPAPAAPEILTATLPVEPAVEPPKEPAVQAVAQVVAQPSDDEIITALATHYGVTEIAAIGWILEMDYFTLNRKFKSR